MNPYNPATDRYIPAPFVGRAAAYARINQHFADPNQAEAAVFVGRRHIGKSALLWHFGEMFDPSYIGVLVTLAPLPTDWLGTMVVATQAALATRDITLQRMEDAPDAPTREWFADVFLPEVFRAIRPHRHLVYLLDDADSLVEAVADGQHRADTFQFLSDLIARNSQLGMVVTLNTSYEDEARIQHMEPLASLASLTRLGNLSKAETAILLRRPTAFEVEDEAVTAAYQSTGGYPQHLQRLGAALYTRWEANGLPTLTAEDVFAVLPDIYRASKPEFDAVWAELALNEQLVLTGLNTLLNEAPNQAVTVPRLQRWVVQTDYPLDETSIKAAVRGLEYREMLQYDGQRITLTADLLRLWLTKNAQLETLSVAGERPLRARRWVLVALIAVLLLTSILVLAGLGRPTPPTPVGSPTVTLESQ